VTRLATQVLAALHFVVIPVMARAAAPLPHLDEVGRAITRYAPSRLPAQVKDLVLNHPEVVRRRWRALGVIVLLRMARVYVDHHTRGARQDGPMPDGFDSDIAQSIAAIDPSLLADTALEIGELTAALSISRATHSLLARRFAAAMVIDAAYPTHSADPLLLG
jgi:hypothetical protein